MKITKEIEALIERIAKEEMHIETLETRKSDSLDFHDTAVWAIKSALTRAFVAGAVIKNHSHTLESVKS